MPPFVQQSVLRDIHIPSPGAKRSMLVFSFAMPLDWVAAMTTRNNKEIRWRFHRRSVVWSRFEVGDEKGVVAEGFLFSCLLHNKGGLKFDDIDEPGTPRCLGGHKTTVIHSRRDGCTLRCNVYPPKKSPSLFHTEARLYVPVHSFAKEIQSLCNPRQALDVWTTRPVGCLACIHPHYEILAQCWVPLIPWDMGTPRARALHPDDDCPFLPQGYVPR